VAAYAAAMVVGYVLLLVLARRVVEAVATCPEDEVMVS
jgi:hypothetical protein